MSKNNSFSKGFKFAAGIILFIVIFLYFFRPSIVIGPVDSNGKVAVPKEEGRDIIYSSIPIKEVDTKSNSKATQNIESIKECPLDCDDYDDCTKDHCSASTNYECQNEQIVPCCRNDKCEEGENYSTCRDDCQSIILQINSFRTTDLIRPEGGFARVYGDQEPDEDNTFLVIDVTLNNQGYGDMTIGPTEFFLQDDTGLGYQIHMASSFVKYPINMGNLNDGEKIRGDIVFEIPISVKEYWLSYGQWSSYKQNKQHIEIN